MECVPPRRDANVIGCSYRQCSPPVGGPTGGLSIFSASRLHVTARHDPCDHRRGRSGVISANGTLVFHRHRRPAGPAPCHRTDRNWRSHERV